MFSPIMFFKPSASTTLTTGLVHYWKLDNNNTDVYSRASTATDLTYSTSYGKVSYGVSLNGTSSNLNFGATALFGGTTTSRSVAFWCYPQSNAYYGMWLSTIRDGEIYIYKVNVSTGYVRFLVNIKIGTTYQSFYTNAVSISSWCHFCYTLDLTNRVVLTYINGVYDRLTGYPDAMQTGSLSAASLSQRLGANVQGTPGEFVQGYVDELGMWNRVLTPSEVQELYWSGFGNQYPFTP